MFQHPVQYVKKTTVQVVEASITVIISPFQDYTHPDGHIPATYKGAFCTGILISVNFKILLPCLFSNKFVEPDIENV